MIRIFAFVLGLILALMLIAMPADAQGPAAPKSANATPIATTAMGAILYGAQSANPGEKLFGQKCAFCHIGPSTGKFMLARRLPKGQAELPDRRDLTPDYVKAVVRNGLVNMPTFTRVELTDRELGQIADWLGRKGRK
ncbi:c-type cytochrome [Novosphingobium sediminicola]|uniref:Mono/diheme cytochrome c family protein n=1 Tax=Novosphingobium sediminicola TaxID=563162 RepID=A0A7W6CJ09_9SPHN|nr:cytochrome c [Novosphingobium sediminicola]MBB3955549.1 mono/diheme cytochrome c family protein [Novosphingobium sediminicola]